MTSLILKPQKSMSKFLTQNLNTLDNVKYYTRVSEKNINTHFHQNAVIFDTNFEIITFKCDKVIIKFKLG